MNDELKIKIRNAFNKPKVQEKWNDWFDDNMVYCSSAHGFVHRLFDAFKDCESYRDAQNRAFDILDEMRLEFLIDNHYIQMDERKECGKK
jgi:hypothetical protein